MKITTVLKLALAVTSLTMMVGCAGVPNQVAVGSGTTVGLDVSANPAASGTPQATLAYKRVEFATAPVTTNGLAPDVLMEFRLNAALFSAGGGVYSRIAMGPHAVVGTPATMLFSKGVTGVDGHTPESMKAALAAPQPK